MKMKTQIFALSVVLGLSAQAQILDYSPIGLPNTGDAPVTTSATTVAVGLSGMELSRGPGLGGALLANGFSANQWGNPNSAYEPASPSRDNALSRGDYFQFGLTVEPGYTASLTTLDAWLRRSALNAPMNYEFQYSLDGFTTLGVTIQPEGSGWTELNWTESYFTYRGRTSGTAGSVEPYDWMIKDVPGRPNTTTSVGDPIPTIDLSEIAELQNIAAGTTVTFRLYGWGNDATADSNTVALGRMNGPSLGGLVSEIPEPTAGAFLTLGLFGLCFRKMRRRHA